RCPLCGVATGAVGAEINDLARILATIADRRESQPFFADVTMPKRLFEVADDGEPRARRQIIGDDNQAYRASPRPRGSQSRQAESSAEVGSVRPSMTSK